MPLFFGEWLVKNVPDAKAMDYKKAEVTVLRSKQQPSAVLLPVVA